MILFRNFYYNEVGQKLHDVKTDKVVATYEYNGKAFIGFGKKIGNGELALFGIVPLEAVSAGVGYIHASMFGGMILFSSLSSLAASSDCFLM